ncbi:MAG TPA: LysM domain-containing protein [Acidimicrobiia bacterium]|jgi:nucleoid-associated protein YgaU
MAAVMTTDERAHERAGERRRVVPPARAQLALVHAPADVPRRRVPARAVYRRRRVVVAALALGTVALAGRAGMALGGTPLATSERRPPLTYVVRPGDSLWTIARHVAPSSDPRGVVDDLNAPRHGAPLVPGETITWQP